MRRRKNPNRDEWLLTAFDNHFLTIYSYLARRVGRDLADDLASEVFVTAYQRQSTYNEDQGSVIAWLYGIATNLLRNHHRAEMRQLAAYERHTQEARRGLIPGLFDESSDFVLEGHLVRAIALLSARQRDVLLLFAWGDLSYEEIAKSLALPIGTVRSRLARARMDLRSQLERPRVDTADATSQGGTDGKA